MNVAQQIIWPGTALSGFLDQGPFADDATDIMCITLQMSTGTTGEDSNQLRLDSMRFLKAGE